MIFFNHLQTLAEIVYQPNIAYNISYNTIQDYLTLALMVYVLHTPPSSSLDEEGACTIYIT